MNNPIDRCGAAPQFLHWLTVILVIVAWTLGTFGDDLPKGAARDTGLFVHISAGLVIVASFHAAALVHHFVFGDNTLVRMLPGSKP